MPDVICGDRLRAARERRKWTAPELASRMCVSAQTVYRWEWGKTQPSRQKGQALALELGVAFSEIEAIR
jgi:transcriptional regulator with XRE-family HTH domain